MKKVLQIIMLVSLLSNAASSANAAAGSGFGTKLSTKDAYLASDNDKDGLLLWKEILFRTDPIDPDTDDDFLLDGEEDPDGPGGTDPLDPDTDHDGFCDSWEVNAGSIATNPSSVPSGTPTKDGTCPLPKS